MLSTEIEKIRGKVKETAIVTRKSGGVCKVRKREREREKEEWKEDGKMIHDHVASSSVFRYGDARDQPRTPKFQWGTVAQRDSFTYHERGQHPTRLEMAFALSDRIGYFHAYGYATRKQITLCPA